MEFSCDLIFLVFIDYSIQNSPLITSYKLQSLNTSFGFPGLHLGHLPPLISNCLGFSLPRHLQDSWSSVSYLVYT